MVSQLRDPQLPALFMGTFTGLSAASCVLGSQRGSSETQSSYWGKSIIRAYNWVKIPDFPQFSAHSHIHYFKMLFRCLAHIIAIKRVLVFL